MYKINLVFHTKNMKKQGFFYRILLVSACIFMPFLFGNVKKSDLKEISKPYAGTYECKKMQYGDRDLKEYVKGATLELKNDGTYVLTVELKNGKTRQSKGAYEVDGETIAFVDKTKKNAPRRVFSRKNDEIEVIATLHGKTLYFLFSRAG